MNFNRLFYILTLVSILGLSLNAQHLDQPVTLKYNGQSLGFVLEDISSVYDIRFTYSRDFIPMDHPISIDVKNIPLGQALDKVFASTPVVYKYIGGNIALKVDENKQTQIGQLDKLNRPQEINRQQRLKKNKVPHLPGRNTQIQHSPGGDRVIEFDPSRFSIPESPKLEEIPVVQVALYSIKRDWDEMDDVREAKVLIDVLGGYHSKIEGVNIGGGVNNVHHNVKGVQIAGIGNNVNKDVKGVQTAFIYNKAQGGFTGVQASGIYNHAGDDIIGLQFSGGVNIAKKNSKAVQFAGLVNYAGDSTITQFSGLANIAGDVNWSQTTGLFNKAKVVKGFQFGLINVADSVALGSYGLFNFIKKGYNRIELAGSDALYLNLALKLGTRQFYNIFHFGARWDDIKAENHAGMFMSWGLGYGLGTAITTSPRSTVNLEVTAIHINELEAWTNRLNLLNQFRVTYDFKINDRLSIFAGPSANVFVREFKGNTDPQPLVSNIAPYTIFDGSDANSNLKVWVGINAGIRFL